MLQIKDIRKEYRTGDLVQKALDGVSLNLRDNEFVAILGPSGSGKTTMLNIIGGLDRYDSGDLIINGISTKKYSDADWDSYRNHTIGFVFQSYNLIPHQTVLANVELALTISGISRSERRKRAIKALQDVGLGEQIHKKPNQMSGGQMQRVALARALVNDPDILLADEPTGALDSETSVQVMDLLKEVAKDRLVVMVTHNPELAKQYATRIVSVKDGKIIDDTDPFVPEETNVPARHENMGKSSMSFTTALYLSFNNLLTKKARTVLVAFAGSIGIIGIALILSLSTGVNAYVHQTEENALSEYPLEISKNAMDMSVMMGMGPSPEGEKEETKGDVREASVISSMFTTVTENDLGSLKEYLESDESGIDEYVRAVEYQYDVTPSIYLMDEDESIHQVNPNTMLTESGLVPTSSLYSSMFNTSVFTSLPEEKDLYENTYEVMAGRWPKSYNEAVVVLSDRGSVSDMTLYSLGMKDFDEYAALVESLSTNEDVETEKGTYDYEDFIGIELKLVNAADCYVKDESLNIYTDRSDDEAFMKNLVSNGETLKIVGVVQNTDPSVTGLLSTGVCYTPELIEHTAAYAVNSDVVKAQMEKPEINVLTGEKFGTSSKGLSQDDLFTVNTDALSDAFSFDTSAFDLSGISLDLSGMDASLSERDLEKIAKSVEIDFTKISMDTIISDVVKDFTGSNETLVAYAQNVSQYLSDENTQTLVKDTLNEILDRKMTSEEMQASVNELMEELTRTYIETAHDTSMDGFEEFLQTEQARGIITEWMKGLDITFTEADVREVMDVIVSDFESVYGTVDTALMEEQFNAYMESDSAKTVILKDAMEMLDVNGIVSQVMGAVSDSMSANMTEVMNQVQNSLSSSIASAMKNAFSFNPDALENLFTVNMTMEDMTSAMKSMMTGKSVNYDTNLENFGYADMDDPSSIVIYPTDFDAKQEVRNIIDGYNDMVTENGDDDKYIIYVDAVATLMSSVTDIVNTITYVLIAFVAISLVVSSIMIGIITYISVLERQKEIGILRAIGASKRNVSNVFNAETFITGLLAGAIGIGVTLILLIPGNALIHALSGNTDVNAYLPMSAGLVLIALSVVLTMIGGIIPSKKAANSDPVKALRTE